MIDAPLALAFASGMVAAVNPCGFAMLPAYLSFFLGVEEEDTTNRSVLRVLPVAVAVSAGFVAVFGVVGIVLRSFSSTVQEYAPWATMVIGTGLVILGLAMFAGLQLTARLPRFQRGGGDGRLLSMFLFGVSYAIASLTCTIGFFIATIVGAFSRADFVSGVAVLVAYALGMGLVITTLTVGIALARDSVLRVLRAGMRHTHRIAATLMVAMGAYVAWYGIYSLRVRDDARTFAGPVDWVEEWSGKATRFVQETGSVRLGVLMVVAIAAMVGLSVLLKGSGRSLSEADEAVEGADTPAGVDR